MKFFFLGVVQMVMPRYHSRQVDALMYTNDYPVTCIILLKLNKVINMKWIKDWRPRLLAIPQQQRLIIFNLQHTYNITNLVGSFNILLYLEAIKECESISITLRYNNLLPVFNKCNLKDWWFWVKFNTILFLKQNCFWWSMQ